MSKTSRVWIVRGNDPGAATTDWHRFLGCRVRVFTSVSQALMALRTETPEIIFLEGARDSQSQASLRLLKSAAPRTLLMRITSADATEASASAEPRLKAAKPAYGLSSRERQILQLMVEGFINKEIAEQLSISYFTVENHQRKIYEKLCVHTRTAAVAKALLEKLVES